MNNNKIPRITFFGTITEYIAEQHRLIHNRYGKRSSSMWDFTGIHQCKRDRQADIANAKIKPKLDKFIDIGVIEY